jgi:hypothetical protein
MQVERLTPRGRIGRLGATLVAAVLLLAGTLFGQDDHFPFGPFRMYSTSSGANADAPDTRVEATDTTGATILLNEHNSGVRRAEIEGQLDRYSRDPSVLREVADAYASRNPDAPGVVEVRVVIRWHEIRDGSPTGQLRDEIIAHWSAS